MRFITYSFVLLASALLGSCNHAGKMQKTNYELIPVFQDSVYQLTGVAVSKEGRLFTNYPHWSDTYKYALVETFNGSEVKPFPDAEWNDWKEGKDPLKHWICVQAVVIDKENNMWVVDPASLRPNGVVYNGQKLVKINLKTNQVERVYPLADVTSMQSYINDVRIDTDRAFAYLTNSSEGGIVIVDLKSGKARQVLEATDVTLADKNYIVKVKGKELKSDNKPFHVQSDGIALNADGTKLYFKALTDDRLFSVATSDLRDENLSKEQLIEKVSFLGYFIITDGMEIDQEGNLYLGDYGHRSIVRIKPDLRMDTLIQDERLIWPDSYQISEDGYLYISISQIDRDARFHDGKSLRKDPYAIYKMRIKKE